jgi:hypothetical protein
MKSFKNEYMLRQQPTDALVAATLGVSANGNGFYEAV